MNFTPVSKEQFIANFKVSGYEHLTRKEKEEIYFEMCNEAFTGLIAMNALGGSFSNEHFDESIFSLLAPKEAQKRLAIDFNCNPEDINPENALNYYIDQFLKANEDH